MASIVTGLVGGLVATAVMTAFMMALGDDSPPPTAQLWATYVGDQGPEEYMLQGMALHFLYGIASGGVLAALLVALEGSVPLVDDAAALSVAGGLVWGIVWGIVLLVVGMVLWMNVVLDMDPEPEQMGTMALFHLVYGVVLGAYLVWGVPA